jgi:hypothetical protein
MRKCFEIILTPSLSGEAIIPVIEVCVKTLKLAEKLKESVIKKVIDDIDDCDEEKKLEAEEEYEDDNRLFKGIWLNNLSFIF